MSLADLACLSGFQVRRTPNLPGTLLLGGIGSLTCHVRVVAVSGEKCKGTLTYEMEKREERRILSS